MTEDTTSDITRDYDQRHDRERSADGASLRGMDRHPTHPSSEPSAGVPLRLRRFVREATEPVRTEQREPGEAAA